MKKLALALVCLVSVAFLASCDPTITNPEPSITVEPGEDYLSNGEVIQLGVEYPYAFRAASNAQTMKPLTRMEITCTAGETVSVVCDTTITGTEFLYEGVIFFQMREIVGNAEITAKVTDAAGETATATIKVDIENVDTLEPTDFTWIRRGANLQGDTEEIMAALGLKWYDNHKEVFATIKPLNENCKMYVLNGDVFETVTTDTEMAALFSDLQEHNIPVQEYRNVSANASADYNDVLAVIAEDGIQYLVHITHADIETGSFGTQISIAGQFK